jgi:hypothetical protein
MTSLLDTAIERIRFSRKYTLALLERIDGEDWFRMPEPQVTHLAWQMGHLAMADYRLLLERIRGARPDDVELISADFLRLFGKTSVPQADQSQYPAPTEIRAVFDRVHQQALRELPDLPEPEWNAPPVNPHTLFNRKIDSLFWCAHHEMLHAGQIGLLRRLLGSPPVW